MSYQLPEPVGRMQIYERESQRYGLEPMSIVGGFTADQVLAAYLAGIEEAAKLCRTIRHQGYVPPENGAAATYYNDAAEECESAIRALAADGLVERKP